MYAKDAARAIVELSEALRERIETVNYLLAGVEPVPSAGELADVVRDRLPSAQISFEPDTEVQRMFRGGTPSLDDGNAQREWGWRHEYGLEEMMDDFLRELEQHPHRYA